MSMGYRFCARVSFPFVRFSSNDQQQIVKLIYFLLFSSSTKTYQSQIKECLNGRSTDWHVMATTCPGP